MKFVIANRRFSNWSRGQNLPGSWKTIYECEGKAIGPDIPLTKKAITHHKANADSFGVATFRGKTTKETLSKDDIISIISATKRGDATLYGNRMNEIIGYKVKAK